MIRTSNPTQGDSAPKPVQRIQAPASQPTPAASPAETQEAAKTSGDSATVTCQDEKQWEALLKQMEKEMRQFNKTTPYSQRIKYRSGGTVTIIGNKEFVGSFNKQVYCGPNENVYIYQSPSEDKRGSYSWTKHTNEFVRLSSQEKSIERKIQDIKLNVANLSDAEQKSKRQALEANLMLTKQKLLKESAKTKVNTVIMA